MNIKNRRNSRKRRLTKKSLKKKKDRIITEILFEYVEIAMFDGRIMKQRKRALGYCFHRETNKKTLKHLYKWRKN